LQSRCSRPRLVGRRLDRRVELLVRDPASGAVTVTAAIARSSSSVSASWNGDASALSDTTVR
jgi:hypothetical protein